MYMFLSQHKYRLEVSKSGSILTINHRIDMNAALLSCHFIVWLLSSAQSIAR